MHVLHTRAMGVQTAWERGTDELWDMAWCPVLQGMARLCCDSRANIRTQALTLLQRSLLVADLQVLSPSQWEFAFLRVLFPMLRKLLEMGGTGEHAIVDQGREETKLRAAMMLSKEFLQHLGPLSNLPTFPALWLTILDLVGQFCATASTDILADALPESLKNMLLVMDTSGRGLFFTDSGTPTALWGVTWGKIDTFLPGLREELFPDWEKRAEKSKVDAALIKDKEAVIISPEQAISSLGSNEEVKSDGVQVAEGSLKESDKVSLPLRPVSVVSPVAGDILSNTLSSIPVSTQDISSTTATETTPVLASLTTSVPPSSLVLDL